MSTRGAITTDLIEHVGETLAYVDASGQVRTGTLVSVRPQPGGGSVITVAERPQETGTVPPGVTMTGTITGVTIEPVIS